MFDTTYILLKGRKLEFIPMFNFTTMQIVPMRLFCFDSLVKSDMVCCYLLLFLLYINIEIGKDRYKM